MEAQNIREIGMVNDITVLEVIDAIEDIIEKNPENEFGFGLAVPAESFAKSGGILQKVLFIGRTGVESLKMLASLHKSFSARKNFKNLSISNLEKLTTAGAGVVLYILMK